MSSSDRLALARPDTMHESGGLAMFIFCGGKGAGSCINPLGTTSISLFYQLPNSIVRNKELLFQNIGVQLFADGGPDGFGCSHSAVGSPQTVKIALSTTPMTEAQMQAKGVALPTTLLGEILFKNDAIPQPIDPTYANGIWVNLYWGNASLINPSGNPVSPSMLKITKHNYDIHL